MEQSLTGLGRLRMMVGTRFQR